MEGEDDFSQAPERPKLSIKGVGCGPDVKWQFLFRIDWFLKFAKIKQKALIGISQNSDG